RKNRTKFGTAQRYQFSVTLQPEVIECAENDKHTQFAQKAFVGSRRPARWNREGSERARGIERAERKEVSASGKSPSSHIPPTTFHPPTSSGAYGRSMCKMSMPIVISTLENP
ncbi:hypothetical protein PMAYCL1PPCAC_26663, partial [Pristionchus mayeri]